MMAHPPLAYNRDRARQIARGTWQPWADPAQVRDHIARLLQTSTFQAVGRAAQVGEMTVWEIAHGIRPAIKQQTAAALLAVHPGDLQPQRAGVGGGMWRLRSLVAMGHTTGRIARALGAPRHVIEPLIRGERATITTALRDDINRLWDTWWDKRPPCHTPAQKAAACKALQRAAVHNWPCPAALDEDELDTPGYKPADRWRYARGTGIAADDPLGKNRHNQPRPGPVRAIARPARQTQAAGGYPQPGARGELTKAHRNQPREEPMQDNEPGTGLARDGDGHNLEAGPVGYPGAEASTGDGRPATGAASPGAGREAWLESYRAAVAGLQQRNRAYLADRAGDLARELGAEAANPSHRAPQAGELLVINKLLGRQAAQPEPPTGRGHARYQAEAGS